MSGPAAGSRPAASAMATSPWAAASGSSMPVMSAASRALGKKMSAAASMGAMPSQRRSGSQFVSKELVTPAARASRKSSGSPGLSRGWMAVEPAWRCRMSGSTSRGTSSARSRSMVPVAVRRARSSPLQRCTVAPVGMAGSTETVEVSTPRSRIASSTTWPSRSSPTMPPCATRRPSRARPQAVMADEPPTVRRMVPTSFSTCPNSGVGSASMTRMSGLTSPMT